MIHSVTPRSLSPVHVLMAACNGEKYLAEQIESVLRQAASVRLTIGTEPCGDRTREIVEGYTKFENVYHIANEYPSGSAKRNFAKLMDAARNSNSEYFALCDQDDVWDQDKLYRTVVKIREIEARTPKGVPILVFTDSRVVGEDLSVLSGSFWQYEKLNPAACKNYREVIFQNVGQGCTFLFNRELIEWALPIPEEARMHDHWLMLVASAFGVVSYISEPTLSYRQHSSNVIGSRGHRLSVALNRLFHKAHAIRSSILASKLQAAAFLKRFSEKMSDEQKRFFQQISRIDNLSAAQKRLFLVKNRVTMSTLDRTLGLYLFV